MNELDLMDEKNFQSPRDIDKLVPDVPGLYCIRINNVHKLPIKKLSEELASRKHNILYIGIASESLKKRFLQQELRANGHGTFFRSLGAVLDYRPPKGSLTEKKNKRNYKFSPEDEAEIVEWINDNLKVNWVPFDGNFGTMETSLIVKNRPLLNIAKNPFALEELKDMRRQCVEIANSL